MDQFNFNNFPETNFNEVNLSWMLEVMTQFKEDLESGQFVGPQGPQGPQGEPGPAGDGITEEVKQALLQLARKVAYIDDQGQTYYQDLYDALYGTTPVELVSISAAYTQSGTVYDTDSLDSLKADLVVTATYSDSSTAVIPSADYTLSGSLTVGTSMITVSYQGKTATFRVTVTASGVTLVSISAAFNQGSAVIYESDSLDSLKQYLVVTAAYSDSSTAVIPAADYTLSGSLTVGTSTVTVSYSGQTTTFNVTVSGTVQTYVTNGLVARWDGIDNTADGHDATATTWKDLVGSYDIAVPEGKATWAEDGLVLSGSQARSIKSSSVWAGYDNTTIEMVVIPSESATKVVAQFDVQGNGATSKAFMIYSDNTVGFVGQSGKTYSNSESAITDIKQMAAVYSGTNVVKALVNGNQLSLSDKTHSMRHGDSYILLGDQDFSANYAFKGKILAIRVYSRQLTDSELAQNLLVDQNRFSL